MFRMHNLIILIKYYQFIPKDNFIKFFIRFFIFNHTSNNFFRAIIIGHYNESLIYNERHVYNRKKVLDIDKDLIVEIGIPLKIFKKNFRSFVKPNHQHKKMLITTDKVINTLIKKGFKVLPLIIRSDWMNPPISGKHLSFTWHSMDQGYKNHYHLKVGAIKDFIALDSKGYSGWASINSLKLNEIINNINQDKANRNYIRLKKQVLDKRKSKYKQPKTNLKNFSNSYIFIPLQVSTDSVSSLAYLDQIELLKITLNWAKNNDYNLIIKRHPKCKSDIMTKIINNAEKQKNVIVSNGNIHDLIKYADLILTVNSGVGAESLLHLKPVICTGESDYSACAKVAKSDQELLDFLNMNDWDETSPADIKKFLYYYTNDYMFRYYDSKSIESHLDRILNH